MDTATDHFLATDIPPANRAKLSALCADLRKLPQSLREISVFEGD